VLQCVKACCSVLQCVAVCCSVLQCVAVCCSVLQCVHQVLNFDYEPQALHALYYRTHVKRDHPYIKRHVT